MNPAAARLRVVMGCLFCLLGAAAAVRVLLIAGPPGAKLPGLGFALVLIALGVVRVRTYIGLARKPAG